MAALSTRSVAHDVRRPKVLKSEGRGPLDYGVSVLNAVNTPQNKASRSWKSFGKFETAEGCLSGQAVFCKDEAHCHDKNARQELLGGSGAELNTQRLVGEPLRLELLRPGFRLVQNRLNFGPWNWQ